MCIFRAICWRRNSIERYFSSAKQSRLLNRHQCLGQAKVELHVNMATLAYALTALAHLEADDYENMGMMDIELPGVKRTVEPSHRTGMTILIPEQCLTGNHPTATLLNQG